MSLIRFEQHLKDPYPAFRCHAAGDRSERIAWTARVTHEIGDPVSSADQKKLRSLLGNAGAEFLMFAKAHDGVQLYIDTLSDTVGVQIYRAAELEDRTEEMRQSMTNMGWEEENWPDWFKTGVTIGELPHSANYFVLEREGEHAGKVFYADHDDFQEEPLADGFDLFLNMIVSDPPGFLYERGCYARYSDGKTDKQWIPVEYVADARQ